jgi:hypothetical protein
MTKMSTCSYQENYASATISSSLLIIEPYRMLIRLIIRFFRYSAASSLVVRDEPECEDSKWYLIYPDLG